MHKSIIISQLVVFMVSLVGCGGVSESDYQRVISELDTLKSELTDLQVNVVSLKEENKSLRNELKELKQQVLLARAAARQVEAKEAKSEETPRFYKAKSGDSLWKIARQFQIRMATLQKLNNIQNSKIKIGQQIRLR